MSAFLSKLDICFHNQFSGSFDDPQSSSTSMASCSHTATQTSHPSHSSCRTARGCPSFDSSTSLGQDSTQVEQPIHLESSTTNRYLHSAIFSFTHVPVVSLCPVLVPENLFLSFAQIRCFDLTGYPIIKPPSLRDGYRLFKLIFYHNYPPISTAPPEPKSTL